MANTPSAKKAIRRDARRTAVNKSRRSTIKTYVRKLEEAIVSGDKDAAVAALKIVEPQLVRGAQKGIFHKNTAARRVSRLTKRVHALSA